MAIQEPTYNNEITIAEVIRSFGKGINYITSQWGKLLLAGVIGLGIGIAAAFIVPASYTAQIHFLVEEGKSGGGGGIAAIAGQF